MIQGRAKLERLCDGNWSFQLKKDQVLVLSEKEYSKIREQLSRENIDQDKAIRIERNTIVTLKPIALVARDSELADSIAMLMVNDIFVYTDNTNMERREV